VAWCGLRGAVPLALAQESLHVLPGLAGVDPLMAHSLATDVEGIVFTVVVLNLLLQGLTLPWLCRWLGLRGDPPAGEAVPALLP